jgi:hypothetical protein
MNKPILLVTLLLGGLGCFGSDPNENSQIWTPNPGQTGTGGTTGSGGSGSTGTGGSGSNVTGPIVGTPLAVFASGVDGFSLNTYHDTGAKNLADAMAPASPPPSLSVDNGGGSPDPGMLKVTATYSGPNQYVDIQKNMATMPQDWSGGTLHVRIKIASGTYEGGAQVYVLTVPGSYVFGGTYTNIAANNNWQEFTVPIDAPMTANAGYDPSQVIVFGVQLNNGSMGKAGEVVFNIDSFSIAGVAGGAGGTGGGTAGTAGGTAGRLKGRRDTEARRDLRRPLRTALRGNGKARPRSLGARLRPADLAGRAPTFAPT